MYCVEKDPNHKEKFMLVDTNGDITSTNLIYSEAVRRRDSYNALRKAGDEVVEASVMRGIIRRISDAHNNKDEIALGVAIKEAVSYSRKC